MICPNCGFTANYVVNGDKFCANCLSLLMPYPKTSISDLEKIEPLKGGLTAISKLNETIGKVNRIIDYLNQGVKK